MQIVKVVPKVTTSSEGVFDYSIPPEFLPQIKVGVLVLVPFRGRKVTGIIVDIKTKSKIENLKSIIKIVDPRPAVDSAHIKLARWMADYYISPFSKALFENIVPPAYRRISKDYDASTNVQTLISKKTPVKVLLYADFSKRLDFYLALIKKTLFNKKSAIILVPDLDLIRYFRQKNVTVLHAGLSRTDRWLAWNKIRSQKSQVVIGSNSALFAPVSDLGLIIIDQEENASYKNDRSPRYLSTKAALKLGEITSANVILGSISPSLENYFAATQKKLLLMKQSSKQTPKVLTVDLNFQKGVISTALEEKIRENLAINYKVLLFIDRKGEGIKLSCSDCNWILTCPNCNIPLIPSGLKAHCYRCNNFFTIPVKCPKCNGSEIKNMGVTTGFIQKSIKKLFPDSKTVILENSSQNDELGLSWDIAIATSYALKFNLPKIGLVGIIDADQSIGFPDFRATERAFSKILKFLKIGTEDVIQTRFPKSNFISSLGKLSYDDFFSEEIDVRKRFSFPPFSQLIRLVYKNGDVEKSRRECSTVQKELTDLTKNDDKIVISESAAAYIFQKNKYYRYQIIIRMLSSRPPELAKFLENLPKGWIVDVDPVDLL